MDSSELTVGSASWSAVVSFVLTIHVVGGVMCKPVAVVTAPFSLLVSMAAGRMVSPSGRFALLVSVCVCARVCVCVCVCACDVCDHSSLSGGYPYATLPNKEVLPSLLLGQRLKKPDNCSEEMYVSHSLTTTL